MQIYLIRGTRCYQMCRDFGRCGALSYESSYLVMECSIIKFNITYVGNSVSLSSEENSLCVIEIYFSVLINGFSQVVFIA